jgi:hypothetical protein
MCLRTYSKTQYLSNDGARELGAHQISLNGRSLCSGLAPVSCGASLSACQRMRSFIVRRAGDP